MKDRLVKATSGGIRVYAAVTTDLVNDAVIRHKCQPTASAALGRTMTGALMLAANLKNEEAVTLTFKGDGPLGKIVADAVPEGFVRGYVEHPETDIPLNASGKLDVGRAVGAGIMTVTRFTGLKNPITGSAEIVSGEIAEDITNYLYTSEQTPSAVGLGVLVDTDLTIKASGGFIAQPLPEATDSKITQLEENIKALRPVSSMIADGIDGEGIIRELLSGFDDLKILSSTNLSFRCHCSRERVESVLISLGYDELSSLASEGHAEVVCPFCCEKYQFNESELQDLCEKVRK